MCANTHMTPEQLNILEILDAKGEKRSSDEQDQSPPPSGAPGPEAPGPLLRLRRSPLILTAAFIHVRRHPRPPPRLFTPTHHPGEDPEKKPATGPVPPDVNL